MSTVQQQFGLFHHLESALRIAAKTSTPLTVSDLYDMADIKAVATNQQQVRDKISTLHNKGLVIKAHIPESDTGDKRGRVGYYWKDKAETVDSAHLKETPAKAPRGPYKKKEKPKRIVRAKRSITPLGVPVEAPVEAPVSVVQAAPDVEVVVGGTVVVAKGGVRVSVGRSDRPNTFRIVIE